MFAVLNFIVQSLQVPGIFGNSDWFLFDADAPPAQFAVTDWALEDTP